MMPTVPQTYKAMNTWKKLGWLPYCPSTIREAFPFVKWYMPYNYWQMKLANYRRKVE